MQNEAVRTIVLFTYSRNDLGNRFIWYALQVRHFADDISSAFSCAKIAIGCLIRNNMMEFAPAPLACVA